MIPITARYTLVILCAIIFYLLHVYVFDETKPILEKASEELVIAFIAGIVISFLLETASREELRKAVKDQIQGELASVKDLVSEMRSHASTIEKEAFRTAFRRIIPKNLFDTIEERMLTANFFRTNHRAVWRLEFRKISNVWRVVASVDTRFTLQNLTDLEQSYIPRFALDERSKIAGETAKILSIIIDGKDGDISKFKERHEAGQDSWLEYESQIVPPGGKIEIVNEFEFVRYATDHEMWATTFPSGAMNLRIFFPHNAKKDYFKIDTIGSLEKRVVERPGYADVTISKNLLPDQGLIFYWRFSPQENAEQDESRKVLASEPAGPQISAATESDRAMPAAQGS